MEERYKQVLVKPDTSLKKAIKKMDSSALQIVIVVDDQDKIVGVITDGDVRRAILNGNISFNEPVEAFMNKTPTLLSLPFDKDRAFQLMLQKSIKQIPVINAQKQVAGLVLWSDFFGEEKFFYSPKETPVVIMAGGRGTRLDPFTKILPKPLIPIGDKPIIEVIMKNFKNYGFNNFILSLNYKAEFIKLYFSENPDGYNISYLQEREFLGTAGSLKLAEADLTQTFVVSNCDIICGIDFDGLLNCHKTSGNDATIVGIMKNLQIPYGVIESQDGLLTRMTEKPEYHLIINSGIYILEPHLVSLIPENTPMNMPDLLLRAKESNYKVGVSTIDSCWFDVGHWEEYQKTLEYFKRVENQ